MSETIELFGTSSTLRSFFDTPIELADYDDGKQWMIGLSDFHTFNAIPNIDGTNNRIKIGPADISIPEGAYEVDEISNLLVEILKIEFPKRANEEKLFRLEGNTATLKCRLESVFDVDFSVPNSIAPILGFDEKLYKKGEIHVASRTVDILKVTDIRIQCNISKGGIINGKRSNCIYSFTPTVPPGYKIVQVCTPIIYFPVTTNKISEIIVRILDQNFQEINFRGEQIVVRLHLVRK